MPFIKQNIFMFGSKVIFCHIYLCAILLKNLSFLEFDVAILDNDANNLRFLCNVAHSTYFFNVQYVNDLLLFIELSVSLCVHDTNLMLSIISVWIALKKNKRVHES